MRTLRLAGAILLGLVWLTPAAVAKEDNGIGVLVLAHGGNPQWNATVQSTVDAAAIPYPTEVAFGMAMHGGEVENIRNAVAKLEAQRVGLIIVVPLLVSSESEVMRQYSYILGLTPTGPWKEHADPVAHKATFLMTEPLNNDPVVAEVLLERAHEISRDPASESVLVLAHGPTRDEDNAHWIANMQQLCDTVRERGRFRSVTPLTLRDDAEASVQKAATEQIRDTLVKLNSQAGRTLVVPLLIANGGIEHKIAERLVGLPYVFQEKALLPHPKLSQWIASRVAMALEMSSTVASGIPSWTTAGWVARSNAL